MENSTRVSTSDSPFFCDFRRTRQACGIAAGNGAIIAILCGLVTLWFRSLEIISSLKETDYVDQAYRRFSFAGLRLKLEAVRIALSSGLPRAQIAGDLGVGKSTLGKWVSVYRPSDMPVAPQADLAKENERLRLEIRVLREEREILKNGPREMGSSSRAKQSHERHWYERMAEP